MAASGLSFLSHIAAPTLCITFHYVCDTWLPVLARSSALNTNKYPVPSTVLEHLSGSFLAFTDQPRGYRLILLLIYHLCAVCRIFMANLNLMWARSAKTSATLVQFVQMIIAQTVQLRIKVTFLRRLFAWQQRCFAAFLIIFYDYYRDCVTWQLRLPHIKGTQFSITSTEFLTAWYKAHRGAGDSSWDYGFFHPRLSHLFPGST